VKKKFFDGNMGTYKIGGVPLAHNTLGGRSLKTHIKIKRELFK